jgi:hypothetical protein
VDSRRGRSDAMTTTSGTTDATGDGERHGGFLRRLTFA